MPYLLRNQHAISTGAGTGAHTHTFPWKAARLMIINDSSSADVSFSFQENSAKAVLHPTETITLDNLYAKQIFIDGSAEHRIWIWG